MAGRVAIVGAGMAGASCARTLTESGVDVTVFERGRAPGGRMAAPRLHDRRTDLGAAYFTAKDTGFVELVADWVERGLVREWTDTFDVIAPDGRSRTTGPMRYATPGGLRSLVRDLLPAELDGHYEHQVDDLAELDGVGSFDALVLAMPDPQAARLLPVPDHSVEFEPVISVAAGWDTPCWEPFDAAFVNDDPDITLVADDGARRGDGAAVLVAHSSAERARQHLDDPQAATGPVLSALRRGLRIEHDPDWTHAHRWTFAKPASAHDRPFGLVDRGGRPVGFCTDAWCPTGSPRIESAWRSGRDVAHAVAATLG